MICTPNTGHLVWGYFYALDLLSQVKKLAQHSNSIFAICNSQLLPTNQKCGLLSYPKKTKNPNPSPIGNRFGFFLFGGRGWITQAAHLKRPRRGLFAAGTYSGGRCCSNPPLRRFTNFQIKQKLQCHYNTGVLGGRGWIRTTEAEKQQIYSLSPLATREHAHILFAVIADCLYILSSEVAFVNYFFHGFSLFLSFSIFLRFTAIKALSITAKDPKTFSVLRSFWSW